MLVQFGNNWIQKIALTAKLDSACGLVQFWLSSEFFSSNHFQIGQHVVLLQIQIFVTLIRAGVFIWENFHPGYRDLGRKTRDLGNRASPASHMNTSKILRRKE